MSKRRAGAVTRLYTMGERLELGRLLIDAVARRRLYLLFADRSLQTHVSLVNPDSLNTTTNGFRLFISRPLILFTIMPNSGTRLITTRLSGEEVLVPFVYRPCRRERLYVHSRVVLHEYVQHCPHKKPTLSV